MTSVPSPPIWWVMRMRHFRPARPTSKSQEKKWSKEIRARLSDWVGAEIVPRLKHDLEQNGLPATVRAEGDKVFIDYTPLATGSGYVAPVVMLEFGARSTGEPSEPRAIRCDAAAYLHGVEFPAATPQVMRAERTFWEMATAMPSTITQRSQVGSSLYRMTVRWPTWPTTINTWSMTDYSSMTLSHSKH